MRHANKVLGALAAIVLLLGACFGAYLVLVSDLNEHGARELADFEGGVFKPHYRSGGTIAEKLLWPAYKLDTLCRPHVWKVPDEMLELLRHQFGPP
jgi:hypothetical protein